MRTAVIPARDTSTLRIAQIQNLGEQARTALKTRLPCGQRVADDASQSDVECHSPASCAGCGESGMVREAPRPRETPPHNKAGTGEYHGCLPHDAHTWRGIGAQYWAKGPAGVHVRRSHVKRAQLTPRSASVRRNLPATRRLRPPAAPLSSAVACAMALLACATTFAVRAEPGLECFGTLRELRALYFGISAPECSSTTTIEIVLQTYGTWHTGAIAGACQAQRICGLG